MPAWGVMTLLALICAGCGSKDSETRPVGGSTSPLPPQAQAAAQAQEKADAAARAARAPR